MLLVATGLLTALVPAVARSAYPSRAASVVVPFAAGRGQAGAAGGRPAAHRFGQPVVVENRTGAGGTFEVMKSLAGLDMVHIPFRGSAPAITALLESQVDVLADPLLATSTCRVAG